MTGISAHETMPASVSNDSAPRLRLSTERVPGVKSYSTAPESRLKPPSMVVVAFLPAVVSILKIGVAVEEVAMVQENLVLSLIVVVALVP